MHRCRGPGRPRSSRLPTAERVLEAVQVAPSVDCSTRYPVTADPFASGAVHVRVAERSPGSAEAMVVAPGTPLVVVVATLLG